jgi:DNA transformation protein
VSDSFVEFVIDQLRDLGDVRSRAMFGGYGLYCGDILFGIVYDDRVYFKTDADTFGEYARRGMHSFHPREGQTLRNYYEVPVDVLDDREEVTAWALEAAGLTGAIGGEA